MASNPSAVTYLQRTRKHQDLVDKVISAPACEHSLVIRKFQAHRLEVHWSLNVML